MDTIEEKKYSYFKIEPIPAHILERMEHCRKKHMEVPEETLIKRPSDCRYQRSWQNQYTGSGCCGKGNS